MLFGETLRELQILGASGGWGIFRKTGSQGAHIVGVKPVALAEIVGDLANELVGDALCAHLSESTARQAAA